MGLPITSHIPIVGRGGDTTIHDYAISLLVECPCGTHFMFSGRVGQINPCIKCKKLFRLEGMPTIDIEGQFKVPLSQSASGGR